MEPSKSERAAVIDLGRILHAEHVGRALREGEYPCQDAMWQLLEILEESEQSVIDLLNDYRSKAD